MIEKIQALEPEKTGLKFLILTFTNTEALSNYLKMEITLSI